MREDFLLLFPSRISTSLCTNPVLASLFSLLYQIGKLYNSKTKASQSRISTVSIFKVLEQVFELSNLLIEIIQAFFLFWAV